MKRIATVLLIVLSAICNVYAKSADNILRIRLDDNSPLTVSVNGRFFNKHGRSLTIGDLPAGRHYIRIYEYKEYKDNSGAHARLLYQGNVRIRRNTATYCVLDTKTGDLLVKQQSMEEAAPLDGYEIEEGSTLTTGKFTELKRRAEKETTDTDKMKLVKNSLKNEQLNTNDVKEIMHWFAFEDSKVTFVKWAYSNSVNIDLQKIENELTLESSKEKLRAQKN